jgi:LL-diaminopimelate aminotransferase
MIRINEHYSKLQASYLFRDIGNKVAAFQLANPDKKLIKLGIGDVTMALPPAIVEGFHRGVDEMAADESFKGYGPEQGYEFLRSLIAENDYAHEGITADEIFVSDGAKTDTANFQELFASDIKIGVPDPVYPVYVDTNVMSGRTGEHNGSGYDGLYYLEGNSENGFVPMPPSDIDLDLIYLCFPNNPTGATATREQLKAWVDYALEKKAIILFDAAYEAFIQDNNLPRSIYAIEGAKKVAVEFRSYSKTAGFTGTRCAYTVVPNEVEIETSKGTMVKLKDLWNRRQSTKMNGVSYPVQKAAAAIYSEEGKKQVAENIAYYQENAAIILKTMQDLGYECTGGVNSPYIWVKTGGKSWDFFDKLLQEAAIVITPGSGFGKAGEGYIRISSFNHREPVLEAMERIKKIL